MASKGILSPCLKHLSKTHSYVKVADVCPEFYATESNGYKVQGPGGERRVARVAFGPVCMSLKVRVGKSYHDGEEMAYDQHIFAL